MIRKKIAAQSAFVLFTTGVILSGCTSQPETVKTNTINNNQADRQTNQQTSVPGNVAASVTPTASVPPPTTVNSGNVPPAASKTGKNAVQAVKEPTPQISSGATDFFLVTQARSGLSTDKELINAVIIDMKEGNAVLSGDVTSEAQKSKAGQIVQGIKGIKSVKNNLQIKP